MRSTVDPALLWAALAAVLVAGLTADLWVHRRPRAVPLADAVRWTIGWVVLAAGCALAIWPLLGRDAFVQFAASYAVEWTLSTDNVLAFLVVLTALAVPMPLRYRVLLFGALGAVVLRLTLIVTGTALLNHFDWLTYVFGALLLVAAGRLATEPANGGGDEEAEPAASGLLRRLLPVSAAYAGTRLITTAGGRRLATPLLLALLVVAVTDVLFATDSIPAVFAMTRDPFIASASNALAVLGLRSLYFVLEGAIARFRFLKPALVILLVLISARMLAAPVFEVPAVLSLAAIVLVIGAAALASVVVRRPTPAGHA